MTPMIPAKRRSDFYAFLDLDDAGRYRLRRRLPVEEQTHNLSGLAESYTHYALAVMDLGLAVADAQRLLGEAALASSLAVGHATSPSAIVQLRSLFSLGVLGDAKALAAQAGRVIALQATRKRSFTPDLHALVDALAASIAGDVKQLRRALTAATVASRRVKPSGRRTWAVEMSKLATICLGGTPRSLTPQLHRVAEATRSAWGGYVQLEDQNFESYLAEIPLAFVARAHARGFKLPTEDPAPCMPMALLRLPRGRLPTHAWYAWPRPPAALRRRAAAELEALGGR